jgi:hypothetical protein
LYTPPEQPRPNGFEWHFLSRIKDMASKNLITVILLHGPDNKPLKNTHIKHLQMEGWCPWILKHPSDETSC